LNSNCFCLYHAFYIILWYKIVLPIGIFIDYIFYLCGVFLFLFQVESKNSVLQLQVLNTEIQLKPLINYSWDSISSPAAPEAKGKNTEILYYRLFTLYHILFFFLSTFFVLFFRLVLVLILLFILFFPCRRDEFPTTLSLWAWPKWRIE
jgi:hypothetical protein